MNEIQYIGEHLLPGRLGHLAIVLSFVSGLLAAVSYYFATNKRGTEEEANWKNLGRSAFIVHGLSIFAVIGIIFYVMAKQYYEYQYVWAHVSEDLPYQYILSAFWEGQEGSFLLWLFWHIVLGMILMVKAKKWEAPVLSMLSLVQVFIVSMILGVYIGFGPNAFKLGSNPLLLLRDTMAAPIFAQADYVSQIKGNGLNPLLQNYWMTIHPPTLFLGFASTVVPFCFAIAGLWTREHKAWLKPALPWALFSGAILGLGILMGGAWAYEALTFGGYWAWDPVENMSLVPWLVLVAGIHTNLIAKTTGHSIRTTYIFYILTFVFIIYSTFLTRSGVLGDTSVHAFTEMGLEWQLVAFLATFIILPFAVFLARMKDVSAPKTEESAASKEFWMFIGTLVLLFSAVMITASTSLPVFNKIVQYFNPVFEGRVITDPVPHYNKYQLWIAVFMAVLSGGAQYLRFKERNWQKHLKKFAIHMSIALAITAVLSFLTLQWIDTKVWQYTILLFAGWFTVVTNLDYVFTFMRGRLKLAGSAFSHLGFGLMLVGVIASGVNKRVISSNPFMMEGLIQSTGDESLRNNVMLIKDSPMIMEGYRVTYKSDSIKGFTRTYNIQFEKLGEKGDVVEEFSVHPNILYNKQFTEIAAYNPSTKRYAHKDIFTHISALPQVEMDFEYRRQREDSLNYKLYKLPADGTAILFNDSMDIENPDTTLIYQYRAFLVDINRNPSHPDYEPEAEDLAISAKIGIERLDEDSVFYVEPVLVLRGQLLISYPAQINEIISKVRLNEQIFNQVFTLEEQLDYQSFTFKKGDQINLNGKSIQFAGFNRQPEHPNYEAQEGDIAVSAILSVQGENGQGGTAQPIFFIRDSKPFNIKAEIESMGLHFRFVKIDPASDSVEIMIAESDQALTDIPIEIATDSKRADWIVMAAIEFPGINLFWLGSLLMLVGLAIAMAHRMRTQRQRA
jgi:cytochrome c-type biogenesis protein CcmF